MDVLQDIRKYQTRLARVEHAVKNVHQSQHVIMMVYVNLASQLLHVQTVGYIVEIIIVKREKNVRHALLIAIVH